MKCSRLNCGHGIGLVSYQRHWFDKRRFCSKKCRDDFTVERPRPSQQERLVGTYFNWLLANATSQAASNDYLRKLARVRPAQWRYLRTQENKGRVADVRFGSKADICSAKGHVRFTPKSGHVQRNSACPLCANSGHPIIHSITRSRWRAVEDEFSG